MFIFNHTLQPLKAYCAIWVRRSNFRHQASLRVSPRESTHRRKVELWAKNVRKFCLNADLYVTFRDPLHSVKLRHGTDGFTSPPKEVVLRIFSPQKSDGFSWVWTRELWVPKASRLPLDHRSRFYPIFYSLILPHSALCVDTHTKQAAARPNSLITKYINWHQYCNFSEAQTGKLPDDGLVNL
jgi:hypothetical protein